MKTALAYAFLVLAAVFFAVELITLRGLSWWEFLAIATALVVSCVLSGAPDA